MGASGCSRRGFLLGAGAGLAAGVPLTLWAEKPLREMAMTAEDKKRIKGFMFLSEKPMLFVLNIGESTELGKELDEAVSQYKLTEIASRPNAAATAICGKVEAELAEMSDEEINWYVATGEPMDKAGAYAIQGHGALFIKEIRGDYFNVVGLPVRLLYRLIGG